MRKIAKHAKAGIQKRSRRWQLNDQSILNQTWANFQSQFSLLVCVFCLLRIIFLSPVAIREQLFSVQTWKGQFLYIESNKTTPTFSDMADTICLSNLLPARRSEVNAAVGCGLLNDKILLHSGYQSFVFSTNFRLEMAVCGWWDVKSKTSTNVFLLRDWMVVSISACS